MTRSVPDAVLQRAFGEAPSPSMGIVTNVVQREITDDDTAQQATQPDLAALANQVLPYVKSLMRIERERYGRDRWR